MLWGKYISVMLASTIKFIGGPLAGLALQLSWLETALCTVTGMMLSVITITFAGKGILQVVQRFRKAKPRRFTSRTRLAIRVWHRFGMTGIALLTPLILTPVGGTILAISFRVKSGQLLFYMLLSAIFWAFVQTMALYQLPGLKELFGG